MLKKSKFANLICAMAVGVIIMLAALVVLLFTGLISLNKTPLVIATDSAEGVYNGIAISNNKMRIESGALKKGHKISWTVRGTLTEVGEIENGVDVVITDELDADVTSDYNIEYKLGRLKITPRKVLVAYVEDEGRYVVTDDLDGLVGGHYAVIGTHNTAEEEETATDGINFLNVTIYDLFHNDVTDNYQIKTSLDGIGGGGMGGSGNGGIDGSSGTGGGGSLSNDFFPLDAELYRVTPDTDGMVYLKFNSYGDYIPGHEDYWGVAQTFDMRTVPNMAISPYYFTSEAMLNAGMGVNQVTIEAIAPDAPYVLPYYTTYSDNDGHERQRQDVSILGGDVSAPYTVRYVSYDSSVTATAPSISAYESNYASYVRDNYLAIDSETRAYMEGIIAAQGFSASDADIIDKIADYISNAATYNLDFDQSLEQSSNIAVDFLEVYGEGVCRHYATSATVLYRALGIPARYCEGFSVLGESGETVTVTGMNAHAWVEVYVDGIGWICVEVTGSIDGSGIGDGVTESNEGIIELKFNQVYSKPYAEEGGVATAYSYPTTQEYITLLGFEDLRAQGYTYEVSLEDQYGETEQSMPGAYVIKARSLRFYDRYGSDVTSEIYDRYAVKQNATALMYVTRPLRVVDVTPTVFEKYYDGSPYTFSGNEQYEITYLYPSNDVGHTLLVRYRCDATETNGDGRGHQISYELIALDAQGNDVRHEYSISEQSGEVHIRRQQISFRTESVNLSRSEYDALKDANGRYTNHEVYLGDALLVEDPENAGYYTVEGSLDDWRFTVEFSSMAYVSKPGAIVENVFTVKIWQMDDEGTPVDITHNFAVSTVYGWISVSNK